MSGYGTATGALPVAQPAPADGGRQVELRTAAAVAVGLVVVGALLGLVWAWWTPIGSPGDRIPAGVIASEDESFIAGDGRFAVLTAVVGLAVGVLAWRLRRARGPWLALALAAGGVVGALVTAHVGQLVQGSSRALPIKQYPGAFAYRHLGLSVHATGLLFLEGAIAVLVFGLCVAFTAHDDLGRPDSSRTDSARTDSARTGADGTGPGGGQPLGYPPGPVPGWSVEPGGQPEGGWGHGDAPGAPQQRYFPPQ